ncbi:hypothetical protein LAZ67_2002623 [Cordylochernes scorpioides]|uniref:CCHC-type domain-containing protein n=1 Tax=Cordylochernes scorpioides TaxID=51811 RepID=A0ABY6K2E6_9ARAC|nr:hypothetical protein LAZ67_2002623 [Cordylochernes scorpioides]
MPPKIEKPVEQQSFTSNFDLPKYDGQNFDVTSWLKFFNKKCQQNHVDEDYKLKNISKYLDGEAFNFYIETLQDIDDWRELEQKLLSYFTVKDSNLFSKFLNLKYNDKDDLDNYFKEKSSLAKKLNLDTPLLLEALTEGMPNYLNKYLIAARVKETSDWIRIATQLKYSTNQEKQQPSTSNNDNRQNFQNRSYYPTRSRFNPNSPPGLQLQPPPRSSPRLTTAHHQEASSRSTNLPPYPCKICSSHQLPNQYHFHRDCPLNKHEKGLPTNNHSEPPNPGRERGLEDAILIFKMPRGLPAFIICQPIPPVVDHEIETLLETDDLEKELQGVEEYREKYITWRFRANKKIRQSDFQGENIPNSNSRIDENEMRHYVPSCTTVKLPKLMISKFYGNFSEWLTFWNSFDAAIHQNNSLNPIDKFNYLKSHLGGTALNTVEGFALSADNYEKAIKLLKDRFGREDILISRHMNNLLSMRPLKTSSEVRTFRELFDNLSVHIRSLESLNVSIDVYGQLLCPIIIKLLPADLNLELNKELPTGYVINDLITFLERQLTAREKSFRNEIGTGNESTSKPNLVNKHPKTRFYNEKPIATASELLNSVHKSNECVFCGKDNHGSPKCEFAANISLNEKRSLMKKKGVCYKCLRPSHLSKFCRNVVRCSICNMSSHLDVMCTKLILDRGGSSKSPTVQDETLANLSTSPDVLLPTLRVTLKGNRTEKTARAIIDTGSQRSYILHSTAMEMEYEQSRREFFRHSLFGGSSTDVVEHEV